MGGAPVHLAQGPLSAYPGSAHPSGCLAPIPGAARPLLTSLGNSRDSRGPLRPDFQLSCVRETVFPPRTWVFPGFDAPALSRGEDRVAFHADPAWPPFVFPELLLKTTPQARPIGIFSVPSLGEAGAGVRGDHRALLTVMTAPEEESRESEGVPVTTCLTPGSKVSPDTGRRGG